MSSAVVTPRHEAIAQALCVSKRGMLLLGLGAAMHSAASALRTLAALLAEVAGVRMGVLSDGPNGAGAWLAGALPQRGAAGTARSRQGRHALAMLQSPRKAYVLFNCEPEADFADAQLTQQALGAADFVVGIGAYASSALREHAHVLLPITPFSETSGTFVNVEGRWQSFGGAGRPLGEARPGWKVLRVLGNVLNLDGFDYASSEAVRDALHAELGERRPEPVRAAGPIVSATPSDGGALERIGDVPLYASDALVRRAPALQQTTDAGSEQLRINGAEAARLGLCDRACVTQGDANAVLPVVIDARVPDGAAWIPAVSVVPLGAAFGSVEVKPV